MRPIDKATADSLSVQSFDIIKKTLDKGILLLAVINLELEMDYPSETGLCTVTASPSPHTPFPIFSEMRGRLYTGYLKRLIHLQTVRQTENWRIESGGLFIQNEHPFHFKLRRITYLTRIIKRITHLTRIIRL